VRTSTLPYAARAAGLVGSVIDSSTSLLHKQTHDVVRFAMGSPATEAVPSKILSGIAAIELSKPDAYDYAATEGDPPLHAALLETLRGTSDETTADRLTITAGGMQGLDLFCKIFVDPGDLVTVESPTYTNGSATALSYGATLLEIPVDDDGMDIDALERLVGEAGRAPKAIYTIPTFQNPSGVTMSLERRLRLLELARGWGRWSSTTTPTVCCGSPVSHCLHFVSWGAATLWCSRSARSPRSSRRDCESAGLTPPPSCSSC